MTIQELIARQQAIVSGARAAGRDLTAEERAEFDGLQRQIDAAGNNPPAQGADDHARIRLELAVGGERHPVGVQPGGVLADGSGVFVDHGKGHGALLMGMQ